LAELPELDPTIHGPVRLAIFSILSGAEEAEFTYLRDRIGATDGNLSVHLSKLEEAGFIAVEKQFVGKKPRTLYRLTERGRRAFVAYVKNLKALLNL
jgi:DNA-binding MarR family transcriptional regulator